MGKKYRRYKNFIEKYLDSSKGKRFFNILYSVGAAVVILGAMFKILHLPYGNQMLMIGMITEAIVFLLSAFESPGKDYKWEEVYPVLADNSDFIPREQRPVNSKNGDVNYARSQEEGNTTVDLNTANNNNFDINQNTNMGGGYNYPNNGGNANGQASNIYINTGSGNGSSSNSDCQGRLSNENAISNPNYNYNGNNINVADINNPDTSMAQMSDGMAKVAKVTESLGNMSDALLDSFQKIIDNSKGLNANTEGYITQVEALNRNLAGLNTIYEIQLKGVSSQINTIENINAGLEKIKRLYDGSMADSTIFKTETEKMAQQLTELNAVYARLLQAMTSNMNLGGNFTPPNGPTQQP